MYGLPQAGMLANQQLRRHLKPAGFYEVDHTTCLWRHIHRPIQFSLIVDDFGVKYVEKKHIDYFLFSLRKHYSKVAVDWTGSLYAGINLEWNYQERWLDT